MFVLVCLVSGVLVTFVVVAVAYALSGREDLASVPSRLQKYAADAEVYHGCK